MPKCIMILPWKNGTPDIDMSQIDGYVAASYVPPPKDSPQFVLAFIEAKQEYIDTLTARSDCLYICSRSNPKMDEGGKTVDPGGIEKSPVNAATKSALRTKIQKMGFDGAKFGNLNAAISSGANRAEIAFALAKKAFARDRDGNNMTDEDLNGTYQ
jgi:hypothetical protein